MKASMSFYGMRIVQAKTSLHLSNLSRTDFSNYPGVSCVALLLSSGDQRRDICLPTSSKHHRFLPFLFHTRGQGFAQPIEGGGGCLVLHLPPFEKGGDLFALYLFNSRRLFAYLLQRRRRTLHP